MNIYTNIPGQFPGLDLLPMTVTGRFWRAGEDSQQLPDRDYFISQCQGDGPLCINIEHWRWDARNTPSETVESSLDKLSTLTRWVADAFPGRVIGHYSIFPIRDYWSPVTGNADSIAAWQQANANMSRSRDKHGQFNSVGLADLCHVTMPSLYTFYEDQAGWIKYAKANIAEARKYGKPVIPFIWPRYHGSNASLRLSGIPADYWKLQLDTLAEADCQGVVIWDSAQYFSNTGGEAWTDETPWIAETRKWMRGQ